jgi:hypothetical protein
LFGKISIRQKNIAADLDVSANLHVSNEPRSEAGAEGLPLYTDARLGFAANAKSAGAIPERPRTSGAGGMPNYS